MSREDEGLRLSELARQLAHVRARLADVETGQLYDRLGELARKHETGRPGGGALVGHERRVFSQTGEDGLLAELFARIGAPRRWFVEFGVQTGAEANCVFLADVCGWSGLFLEADEAGFAALDRKYGGVERVRRARAAVTPENVNALFEGHGVPPELDLLSIDIDGNDYWVWKALRGFRPRVVVVEYNAHLGLRDAVQPYDPRSSYGGTDYFGASLVALDKLARARGYALVHCTLSGVNAFFVRADLCGDALRPVEPAAAFRPPNYDLRGRRHRAEVDPAKVYVRDEPGPA